MGLLSKFNSLAAALTAMSDAMQGVIDKTSPFLTALSDIDNALGDPSSPAP